MRKTLAVLCGVLGFGGLDGYAADKGLFPNLLGLTSAKPLTLEVQDPIEMAIETGYLNLPQRHGNPHPLEEVIKSGLNKRVIRYNGSNYSLEAANPNFFQGKDVNQVWIKKFMEKGKSVGTASQREVVNGIVTVDKKISIESKHQILFTLIYTALPQASTRVLFTEQ